MGRSITYTCDVCGAIKQETNHWFDVFVEVDRASVKTLTEADIIEMSHIEIHPFDPDASDTHVVACGQSCVIKLVSSWMETGGLDGAGKKKVSTSVDEPDAKRWD